MSHGREVCGEDSPGREDNGNEGHGPCLVGLRPKKI